MPNFIVRTHEAVAGTYRVKAKYAEHAENLFREVEKGNLKALHEAMDEGIVEQLDYLAFSVEVQEITGE